MSIDVRRRMGPGDAKMGAGVPREVDEARRLDQIAQATVGVARDRGPHAVTIRAVADRLGRSTAFITNFLPSRAHLMVNALEHAREHWRTDRAARVPARLGLHRLVNLARWMCTSTADDEVLRGLWIEVVADAGGAGRRAFQVVRAVTDETFEEFLRSAKALEIDEASAIADILYLYCRGYEVKAVEDPEVWNTTRVSASLEVLLRLLFEGLPDWPVPPPLDPVEIAAGPRRDGRPAVE